MTFPGLARREQKGLQSGNQLGYRINHHIKLICSQTHRSSTTHKPPSSPQTTSNNVLPPPPPPSLPLPLPPHTQTPPPIHQPPPPPNLLNLPPTPHRQNDHRRPPRRRARTRAHSLRQRHGPLRARDEPRTARQPADELVEGGVFCARGGVTGLGYGVGEGVSV